MKYIILIFLLNPYHLAEAKETAHEYPIQSFKEQTLKLWSHPGAEEFIRVDTKTLGDPKLIKVFGFAGGSNEHLLIRYQNELMSFSKSKVILDPKFNQRTVTGKKCSKSNLGQHENRAETTSICER